ncbi:preprotein translocase subunit SecE [Listeria sp. FSL L7-1582]|uniref:Protein translocase subunit SecE n=4 Tax=Listeria TaxID=1637 RepID=A0A841YWM9_9LIST|nr:MULTISPECIES: preprotein translocase subunit SecE [Listeria]KGL38062.1 preprotein translocase subunit SecE [Listeriaceae bacterium FSL A5-0209]EUJ28081.1 preprotein translocase subunit SecE [Listeria cornellensis FSL F6-0969]EUJ47307.1 preprotein translocase subunit SecE [Listeria rocourtiae FSL F6-920]KGL39386.1 preprotein translocase subunit SecE [Listeria newyorkensis]KMT60861.1 preprotein translocase subunit SecE [Listeria newyorkensis]
MSAVSRFFRNVKSEMSKVTWPTGKELRTYTITVIIAVACMAVFFMVVDFLIEMLIQFML